MVKETSTYETGIFDFPTQEQAEDIALQYPNLRIGYGTGKYCEGTIIHHDTNAVGLGIRCTPCTSCGRVSTRATREKLCKSCDNLINASEKRAEGEI